MARTPGKNKTRYKKICIFCATDFISSRSDARFCCKSHAAMHNEGIRRDLKAAKIADTQYKVKSLIQELEKSDQVEIVEFADQLRVWLNKFTDKLRATIKNKDLQGLEKIHTQLSKVVKELDLIENE